LWRIAAKSPMTFRNWIKPKSPASASPAASVSERWASMEAARIQKKMKISTTMLALANQKPNAERFELKRYEPAPGVVPADQLKSALAMDAAPYDYLNRCGGFGGYTGFPGYPYLAE